MEPFAHVTQDQQVGVCGLVSYSLWLNSLSSFCLLVFRIDHWPTETGKMEKEGLFTFKTPFNLPTSDPELVTPLIFQLTVM